MINTCNVSRAILGSAQTKCSESTCSVSEESRGAAYSGHTGLLRSTSARVMVASLTSDVYDRRWEFVFFIL